MEEKVLYNATVCFLIKEDEILLALKTQKIGAGCWMGYGGGIEPGETPLDSIIREMREESSVTIAPRDLQKIAIVDCHNTKTDGTTFIAKVHMFTARKWLGEPQETETMITPTWFKISDLPYDKMMPADRYWLPQALAGKKIIAEAHYGPFQKELLQPVVTHEITLFPEENRY